MKPGVFIYFTGCFCVCERVFLVYMTNSRLIYIVGVRSRSYNRHPQLGFLRRVPATKAITELRNRGLFPFQTDPETMPDGNAVNNFAQVKLVFHVLYCYFEGLSRTSDLSRKNLVYLFHGKCVKRQTGRGWKHSSIIFEIRRQFMHRANNFGKGLDVHFEKLIKYLNKHPQLKDVLLDHKHNGTPQLLAYTEVGLRACAKANQLVVGRNCLQSGSAWKKVDYWKKKDMFEAVVKKIVGKKSDQVRVVWV